MAIHTDIALKDIEARFESSGLSMRGGFNFEPGEHAPALENGRPARGLVLIGNVGPGLWATFAPHSGEGNNPLDDWTKRTVSPIALKLGARAIYPSDKPYQPFQRWAMRAEPVYPSPLGMLIHPDHGLWHAYRAALLFGVEVRLTSRDLRASPCDNCRDRPCLSACPVGAFCDGAYDVGACANHLRASGQPKCAEVGCRARDACPVARGQRYGDAQIRFHMAAFLRSRV